MANSSYYYSMYKKEKEKAKTQSKDISSLQTILNRLTGEFYDEQSNVNRELDDLKEDLNKAVRHLSKFNIIVNDCYSYKEKTSTADSSLNSAIDSLENEIASLNSKQAITEQNRDYYYNKYKEEKEKERQEFLNSINIFG